MRLRLQLVERASNASFSVVYRLEAIEGPSGGHYIAEKAVSAIRHIGSIKGLQIIPGCGKGAGHIHAAGQAGAGGALQTAACIHQNGVLAARFQGSNVRKADLFALGQALQITGK